MNRKAAKSDNVDATSEPLSSSDDENFEKLLASQLKKNRLRNSIGRFIKQKSKNSNKHVSYERNISKIDAVDSVNFNISRLNSCDVKSSVNEIIQPCSVILPNLNLNSPDADNEKISNSRRLPRKYIVEWLDNVEQCKTASVNSESKNVDFNSFSNYSGNKYTSDEHKRSRNEYLKDMPRRRKKHVYFEDEYNFRNTSNRSRSPSVICLEQSNSSKISNSDINDCNVSALNASNVVNSDLDKNLKPCCVHLEKLNMHAFDANSLDLRSKAHAIEMTDIKQTCDIRYDESENGDNSKFNDESFKSKRDLKKIKRNKCISLKNKRFNILSDSSSSDTSSSDFCLNACNLPRHSLESRKKIKRKKCTRKKKRHFNVSSDSSTTDESSSAPRVNICKPLETFLRPCSVILDTLSEFNVNYTELVSQNKLAANDMQQEKENMEDSFINNDSPLPSSEINNVLSHCSVSDINSGVVNINACDLSRTLKNIIKPCSVALNRLCTDLYVNHSKLDSLYMKQYMSNDIENMTKSNDVIINENFVSIGGSLCSDLSSENDIKVTEALETKVNTCGKFKENVIKSIIKHLDELPDSAFNQSHKMDSLVSTTSSSLFEPQISEFCTDYKKRELKVSLGSKKKHLESSSKLTDINTENTKTIIKHSDDDSDDNIKYCTKRKCSLFSSSSEFSSETEIISDFHTNYERTDTEQFFDSRKKHEDILDKHKFQKNELKKSQNAEKIKYNLKAPKIVLTRIDNNIVKKPIKNSKNVNMAYLDENSDFLAKETAEPHCHLVSDKDIPPEEHGYVYTLVKNNVSSRHQIKLNKEEHKFDKIHVENNVQETNYKIKLDKNMTKMEGYGRGVELSEKRHWDEGAVSQYVLNGMCDSKDAFASIEDESYAEYTNFKNRNGEKYIVDYFECENIEKIFVTVRLKKSDKTCNENLFNEEKNKRKELSSICSVDVENIITEQREVDTNIETEKKLDVVTTNNVEYLDISREKDSLNFKETGSECSHKSQSNLFCVQCFKIFSSNVDSFNHTCLGKKMPGYLCEFCEKVFTSNHAISLHSKMHKIK